MIYFYHASLFAAAIFMLLNHMPVKDDILSYITNNWFSQVSIRIKTFDKKRRLEDLSSHSLLTSKKNTAIRCCFLACVLQFIFIWLMAALLRIIEPKLIPRLTYLYYLECAGIYICFHVSLQHTDTVCSVQTNRFPESKPCVLAVRLLTGQRTNQITAVFNW